MKAAIQGVGNQRGVLAVLLAVLGLALWSNQSHAQIAVDSASSGSTTSSTITVSHTTSGADRLMLVGVSLAANSADRTVSIVRYNGIDLTPVGTQDTDKARVEIWRLLSPPIGTFNLVVTLSGSPDDGAVAGVVTFTGVDQTSSTGPFTSNTGDSQTASVSVPSAVGELVFDAVAVEDASMNVGGSQTQRWNLQRSKTRGGGSTEPGAAGNVSMSWSLGNGRDWAIGAVAIKPAPSSTTLGNGTDPADATLAPGAAATVADAFTFQTSAGSDEITSVTVALSAGSSAVLSLVEITDATGTITYGSVANPASDAPVIALTGLTATTASTEYGIRVTPKSHAAMPAPAGSVYSVTARVSGWTGTNTQAGTDSAGTMVTIDNLSPADVTAASATTGDAQVSLAWTNPGDADTGIIVVLRSTSAVVAIPTEGATYSVGNTIGASTVACVVATPGSSCTDTGLANDTAYYYKIFTRDTSGNYSTPGTVPSGSPATPLGQPDILVMKTVSTLDDPVNGVTNPKAIPGATLLYSIQLTNLGTGPADADSVVVTEVIPSDLSLRVLDFDGTTVGPVAFVDGTPASGHGYEFVALGDATDDLEFSADGGATYTYVPAPDGQGVDPAVTHIRILPSGPFNGSGGGDPNFQLLFKAVVK
jgi:uncharacterized repeat protein (TIGR01451 family)